MDSSVLLGLSLYTLIGLAPLLYNYYVVSRRSSSVEIASSIKASKTTPGSMITSSTHASTRYNNVKSTSRLDSLAHSLGSTGRPSPQVRPVIILVVNPDEADSDIHRLVVRYLTSSVGEKENSMTPIVGGQNTGVNPGVVGIGPTQITEVEA